MCWRGAYQSTEPGPTLKNTERKEQGGFALGLLQRELEEQMGVNEQLQGQLNSLKKGLRWVEVVAH